MYQKKKLVRQYKLKQKIHKVTTKAKQSLIRTYDEDTPNELLENMEKIKNISNHPE
jgi:hypothetical protein